MTMTRRTRIALAAVLLVASALVLSICIHERPVPRTRPGQPAFLHFDDGGLRYTFHVATGEEGLFEIARDPDMLVNLRTERPKDVERLREELRRRIGVETLGELRNAQRDTMDRLHALGYY
jgi:hypothetical protein